jgi:hypothetical protein
MLHVLIDHPTKSMTIHGDLTCKFIRLHSKPQQQISRITLETLTQELGKFVNKDYRFTPSPLNDDIWLEIDFNDRVFERAVAEYILRLAARHYNSLRGIQPKVHCGLS